MKRWVAMLSLLVACGHQVVLDVQAPATLGSEPHGSELATVTRVIDGDTIEVRMGGSVRRVRLLGIDTPESVDPRRPVQCFGKEAASAARSLLQGRSVRLVKDIEETDGFDRLLRYVYLGEEMANARLVVNGYAYAYTYPPNVRHAELFVALQRDAREHGRGLWSGETCDGDR